MHELYIDKEQKYDILLLPSGSIKINEKDKSKNYVLRKLIATASNSQKQNEKRRSPRPVAWKKQVQTVICFADLQKKIARLQSLLAESKRSRPKFYCGCF